MREGSSGLATFDVAEKETMEWLIQFMYTKQLPPLEVSDLLPLLILSDQFACFPLRAYLVDQITSSLTTEIACQVLNLAHYYNFVRLRRNALDFISRHFTEIDPLEYLQLPQIVLLDIIFDDNLNVTDEKQVYQLITKWGKAIVTSDGWQPSDEWNDAERLEEMKHLLSYVRYPLWSQSDLLALQSDPIFLESPHLLELVDDALGANRRTLAYRSNHKRNGEELLFTSAGDENGVVYHLGTSSKSTRFKNPHINKACRVTCSTPTTRTTRPDWLVGRTFVTTNWAMGSEQFPAYWQIDLLECRLLCNYYTYVSLCLIH